MVTKKIKEWKVNKSPGVDGIPQKLLMETVEQIEKRSQGTVTGYTAGGGLG